MEITLVKAADLKPYSKNRKRHPPEQIERLKYLIETHGFRDPLIVDKNSMEVIAGNGTLMACKELQMAEIPCVLQEFESEEKRYAFSVSHNAIQGWSEIDFSGIHEDLKALGPFDLDELGIKDFQFEPDPVVGLTDEDSIPQDIEAKSKLGDLYILGEHRLLCGDSTNIQHVERLMGGERADLLLIDPPYGLDWSGGTWAAKPLIKSAANWDRLIDQASMDRFLTLASTSMVWGGNYYKLPIARCWLAWVKTNPVPTMADFEMAWTNLDKPCKAWNGACNSEGKRVHPTQKAVALLEWAISQVDNSSSVLDLFGGSGSTLIACEKTKRKCFIMEIGPHYCDVIVTRWEKFTGKTAVLAKDT